MSVTEIELIWESDLAVAVNKPAGLATQTPPGIESLETRLVGQLDRYDRYLSFPHRLDRDVSGVLLVALTKKAARLLSAQFASRKTCKRYLAVVEGHYREGENGDLRWQDHLRKVERRSQAEVCLSSDPGAKLAETIVKTLQFDPSEDRSRLEMRPITGRMHQLRLQCSSRGHPIVGDKVYGATKQHTTHSTKHADFDRQRQIMLHASRLGFHDPTNGRWTEIEANCPF